MIGIAVNTSRPRIQGLMRKKPQPASRTDAFDRRLDGTDRTVLAGSSSIRAVIGATPHAVLVVLSPLVSPIGIGPESLLLSGPRTSRSERYAKPPSDG